VKDIAVCFKRSEHHPEQGSAKNHATPDNEAVLEPSLRAIFLIRVTATSLPFGVRPEASVEEKVELFMVSS